MALTGTVARPGAEPATPRALARGRTEGLSPEDARALWPSLADRALSDNAFFDPAFVGAAAKALNVPLRPLANRDPRGALTGWMPTAPERFGHVVPALRVWAHDYGPLGTPVLDAADAAGTARALIEAAFETAGSGSVLIVPYLPEDEPVTAALLAGARAAGLSARLIERRARAVLDRDAGGTDPHGALPRRRRKEYARQLRRLAEIGAVAFEHAVAPGDVAARVDEFIALEALGWKGRRGTAMAHHPAIATFARTAMSDMARRGGASAITLRVGGKAAATLLCLHQNRTAFTWKIAYDEALAPYSPGAQLMLEAPRFLFADPRIARIDSCATPNHPMVDHLWAGRMRLATLVIAGEKAGFTSRLGIAGSLAETRLRAFAARLRDRVRPSTR